MEPVQEWFVTKIYHAPLMGKGGAGLNRELLKESQQIREFDRAGQAWSKRNYPGGYTSYGSLDKLFQLSSTFETLRARIDRHVARYAKSLDWDLAGGRLEMTDCWINIMPFRTVHSLHLHPLSVVSGTYYVRTPRGCSGLKFEDPRLSRFMAAPPRLATVQARQKVHIEYPATAGSVILFESWLRHEVPPSPSKTERISISFNYHWAR